MSTTDPAPNPPEPLTPEERRVLADLLATLTRPLPWDLDEIEATAEVPAQSVIVVDAPTRGTPNAAKILFVVDWASDADCRFTRMAPEYVDRLLATCDAQERDLLTLRDAGLKLADELREARERLQTAANDAMAAYESGRAAIDLPIPGGVFAALYAAGVEAERDVRRREGTMRGRAERAERERDEARAQRDAARHSAEHVKRLWAKDITAHEETKRRLVDAERAERERDEEIREKSDTIAALEFQVDGLREGRASDEAARAAEARLDAERGAHEETRRQAAALRASLERCVDALTAEDEACFDDDARALIAEAACAALNTEAGKGYVPVSHLAESEERRMVAFEGRQALEKKAAVMWEVLVRLRAQFRWGSNPAALTDEDRALIRARRWPTPTETDPDALLAALQKVTASPNTSEEKDA